MLCGLGPCGGEFDAKDRQDYALDNRARIVKVAWRLRRIFAQ
tara:strand:- start:118 stop:243 length:126 start_codon:yes stop_codon:yes gene_type:complete